jgi:hypothetical protein
VETQPFMVVQLQIIHHLHTQVIPQQQHIHLPLIPETHIVHTHQHQQLLIQQVIQQQLILHNLQVVNLKNMEEIHQLIPHKHTLLL